MVSQVELLLVCAFKLYSVVWCTILKPKKPGNARKSVKTICTWKLDIKGTVKICVRNNWTVTEEKNLWPIVILKPLGKPLGSSGIPPLHPRVKKVELSLFCFQDWFSWGRNQNSGIKPGEHSICSVSSCSSNVISCFSTWQVRFLSLSLL